MNRNAVPVFKKRNGTAFRYVPVQFEPWVEGNKCFWTMSSTYLRWLASYAIDHPFVAAPFISGYCLLRLHVDRRHPRRWITCDKLRRSSEWWAGVRLSVDYNSRRTHGSVYRHQRTVVWRQIHPSNTPLPRTRLHHCQSQHYQVYAVAMSFSLSVCLSVRLYV